MPFVTHSGVFPLVIISGFSDVSANGSAANNFAAQLAGASGLSASGQTITPAAATISGTSVLYAFGRIGNEPNVFGDAVLAGAGDLVCNPRVVRNAVAVIGGAGDLTANAFLSVADSETVNLFITIADAPDLSRARVYSARITADGANIPIKNFSYNEAAAEAGTRAGFTLARSADRAAIEAADEFIFEIYDGGDWREIFAGGNRAENSFSFGWTENKAADSAEFSTNAPISARLEYAPPRNLTIYDPQRLNLSAWEFKTIYDTNGASYPHSVRAVSNLTLFDLFQFVFVEKLGFAGFKTNLPDFPVRRADFAITETYLDGIAGHVGIFNPLFFVRDNVFFILSSIVGNPDGFAAPVALTADRYKSARFSAAYERIDGYVLNYSQNEKEFDYVSNSTQTDAPETVGNFGSPGYSTTTRSRTFKNYYKTASPLVPVKIEKLSESAETRAVVSGLLTTIGRQNETLLYDSFGDLTQIRTESFGLVPDLQSDPITNVFARTVETLQSFFYAPDITNPRRRVLRLTKTETRGLIAVDAVNLILEKPFKQEFSAEAFRAGNLNAEMTTEFGAIRTRTETITQNQNGQSEIRVKTVEFLTDPATETTEPAQTRAGDNSINAATTGQAQIIVLRDGVTPANARKKSLTVAELPLKFALPLTKIRLNNPNPKRGTITLIGFDRSLRRGATVTLFDRDNTAAGNFIIEGFSISGANLGTRDQKTEQVLEVVEIPDLDFAASEVGAGAVRVSPGGDAFFSLKFAAVAGFFISARNVPDGLTIFAKAAPGDAFQNIAAVPLDTTPDAPGLTTYYFKIAADADAPESDQTAQIVFSLQ